jgi:hypothetical protein
MSIKVNHSAESLTPESGVLTVNATGALKLPTGNLTNRPAIASAGLIRYLGDTGVANPEYYDGATWQIIVNKDYVDTQLSNENSNLTNTISNLQLNSLTDVTVTSPVTGEVLVYDSTFGKFRSQINSLTPITRLFTGDGTTLEFDIQNTVSSPNNLVVTINGINQEPYYSYTIINGNIVAFDEAPAIGDRIQIRILRSNTTSDRPRPKITSISYSTISNYTTISIVATDIAYGTGVRIGNQNITRIDYPSDSILQLMIETNTINANSSFWNIPQDLTLLDVSGNEYTYKNLINLNSSKPKWTDSNTYIGRFRSGEAINFRLAVNNATSIIISPAYAGESTISWLTISGTSIVGTAPRNSSPSRYEITVTASNGSVEITKNYWLLVI